MNEVIDGLWTLTCAVGGLLLLIVALMVVLTLLDVLVSTGIQRLKRHIRDWKGR